MSFFPTFLDLPNSEIFNNTADKRQRLGAIGITHDGRLFRYALMGATNIATARLTQSEVVVSTSDELVVPTARAIGDRTVTVTVNLVDGDLAEGYVNVEDDAGEGHLYSIEGNTDDGTTTTVTLEAGHGLVVAWTTATTVGLWQNPWKDLVVCPTTLTGPITGVTPRAHATVRYGWVQVGGLASVLTDGTVIIGLSVMASNGTAGAVEAFGLTEAAPPTEITPVVGHVHEVAATTEESTIMLKLGI